jgi:hypothetical protein
VVGGVGLALLAAKVASLATGAALAVGEQHPVPWTDSWSIRSCRWG